MGSFPTQKQRTNSQIIVRRYRREFSSISSIGASCFQKLLASIRFQKAVLLQIVNVNQSNSRGVAYTTHNGGVVARLQISNDRRLACRSRNVPAALNVADLIGGDNPADDRGLPVIIGTNQCSSLVVQFQLRISQCICDPILRKLRTNGTNYDFLCPTALNNEPANHHMLARLHKAAGAD